MGEGREEWKEGGEGEREGREIGSGGSEEKGREREGREGERERMETRTTRGKERIIYAPCPPHQYQHRPPARLFTACPQSFCAASIKGVRPFCENESIKISEKHII